MLRKIKSKKLFLILIITCLIIVILTVIYNNLSPYNKKLVKLRYKRFSTMKTIDDFKVISVGTQMKNILNQFGKPDDSNYGQFSVDHQYFLFGGNSIVLSVKIKLNKEEDIYHVYYLEDDMTVDMGSVNKGFVLLTECYKHTWLNTKNDPVRVKNEEILPRSGSELSYDFNEWLSIYSSTSSYNYALNLKRDFRTNKLFTDTFKRPMGLQPGELSGVVLKKDYSNIIECVKSDAKKYNFTFKLIGEKEKCSPGNYKTALVLSACGYLWFRQNQDGTWSFKYVKIRDRDFDNDIIFNPKDANSGFDSKFIGFFEVGGIDKKYTE